MGRIIKDIDIEGRRAKALFDNGAVYSYVLSSMVRKAPRRRAKPRTTVALGGRSIEIREICLIQGKIEGLDFHTDVVPVSQLGVADGHELDVIIGARTMEQWQIKLDPYSGTLDLDGLRRHEFVEY